MSLQYKAYGFTARATSRLPLLFNKRNIRFNDYNLTINQFKQMQTCSIKSYLSEVDRSQTISSPTIKDLEATQTPKKASDSITANNSRIKLSHTTRNALRKLYADGPRYYVKATIKNHTFTIVKGDVIFMHRLKGTFIGDIIRLNQVKEMGSKSFTLKGQPFVDQNYYIVRAMVIEHGRGAKVNAKEGRQRKGRRKKVTIKPLTTKLKVLEISLNKRLL